MGNNSTKNTSIKTEEPEELPKNLAAQYSVQRTLTITKNYGLVMLIIVAIILIAAIYNYMNNHHPYFMNQVVPEPIQHLFSTLVASIIIPVVMLPTVITLLIVTAATIATSVSLVISILQFRKIRALKLPSQNRRSAIHSIILNSIPFVPMIYSFVTIIIALIKYYPALF